MYHHRLIAKQSSLDSILWVSPLVAKFYDKVNSSIYMTIQWTTSNKEYNFLSCVIALTLSTPIGHISRHLLFSSFLEAPNVAFSCFRQVAADTEYHVGYLKRHRPPINSPWRILSLQFENATIASAHVCHLTIVYIKQNPHIKHHADGSE